MLGGSSVEARRIEPLANGSLAVGKRNLACRTSQDRVPKPERRPALSGVYALHLPSADHGGQHLRRTDPTLAVTEGQRVDPGDSQTLGAVRAVDNFLGSRVAGIQEAETPIQFRPGVGCRRCETRLEPFLIPHLQRVVE